MDFDLKFPELVIPLFQSTIPFHHSSPVIVDYPCILLDRTAGMFVLLYEIVCPSA